MKNLKYERDGDEWSLVWTDTDESAGVSVIKFPARKRVKYPYGVTVIDPLYGTWNVKSKHTTLEAAKKAGLRHAKREP